MDAVVVVVVVGFSPNFSLNRPSTLAQWPGAGALTGGRTHFPKRWLAMCFSRQRDHVLHFCSRRFSDTLGTSGNISVPLFCSSCALLVCVARLRRVASVFVGLRRAALRTLRSVVRSAVQCSRCSDLRTTVCHGFRGRWAVCLVPIGCAPVWFQGARSGSKIRAQAAHGG